jgi:hypothetical protein
MTRFLLCTFPSLLSSLIALSAAYRASPSNPVGGGAWVIAGWMTLASLGMAAKSPWTPALFLAGAGAAAAGGFRSIRAVPDDPAGWLLLGSAVAGFFALLVYREVRRALLALEPDPGAPAGGRD